MTISEEIDRRELFGNLDANIGFIKESMEVDIMQRDNELIMRGKDAQRAAAVFKELSAIIESGETLDTQKVNYVIIRIRMNILYLFICGQL